MSPSILLHHNPDSDSQQQQQQQQQQVRLIGGASGGPKIITATTQMILNIITRGASGLQAMLSRRVHAQLSPDVVSVDAFDPLRQTSLEALLAKKGHTVAPSATMGAAQFIGVVWCTVV